MNESGINPVEFKVVIKPDDAEELTGRAKLIVVPDTVRDRQAVAKCEGTLIAIGGRAFQDPDWGNPTPKIGDRVYFAKYAGIRFQKDNGETDKHGRTVMTHYVLCNDKDIAGIIEETAKVEENTTKPERKFT